jgi:hypothetical protein
VPTVSCGWAAFGISVEGAAASPKLKETKATNEAENQLRRSFMQGKKG